MEKSKIIVSITDNDLWLVLDKHVDNKHIAKLLFDVLRKNHKAIEWLLRMNLGNGYPVIPEVGACGYMNIVNYAGWGSKTAYEQSEFNQHGFIPVTIVSFSGLDAYHPLTVAAPKIKDKNGDDVENQFHLNLEEFIPEDKHDPYQAKLEGGI
jgi:hypothetical protein